MVILLLISTGNVLFQPMYLCKNVRYCLEFCYCLTVPAVCSGLVLYETVVSCHIVGLSTREQLVDCDADF